MKVSITGFTPAHQNTKQANRKNIIQVPLLLMEAIKGAGHEVGYNLPDADVHIVYIFTLGSINSGFAVECLELIKNNPGKVILSIDDWRVKHIYEGMEKTIATKKFSKSHPSIDWKGIMSNLDVLQDIVDGKFKTLIPAHKTGDISLIEARGEVVVYDPSCFVERQKIKFDQVEAGFPYDLMPIHASLAPDHKWLDKRRYSFIQVQNEKEDKVWELYNKHRIVMSAPYYSNGSGWWRNRYSLANAANAVIIEDIGSVFGPAYEIDRKKVTPETIDILFDKQNKAYHETIMTKEECSEVVGNLLKEFEK